MGFRGRIVFLFLLSTPMWAQVIGGSASLPPAVQCTASTGVTPTLRTEGITEVVADIMFQCSGGTPTASGSPAPQVNISLTLNTGFTSQVVGTNGSRTTEAVLLIDDPGASTNPSTPQTLCTTPETGCGGVGPVKYGVNTPNVYLGLAANSTTLNFSGIPFDPPSSTGVRQFRITNVRANANQGYINSVASNSPTAFTVTGGLVMTDTFGNSIPVSPQKLTLAKAIEALGFSVSGSTLTQSGNTPPTSAGGGAPFFTVTFTEGFLNSFKKRDMVSNATNPDGIGLQNVPGQNPPYTEGGFIFVTPQTLSSQPAATQTFFNTLIAFPGLPNGGTLFQTTLEVPAGLTGLKFSVPAVSPLYAGGSAPVGTVRTSALGGTASGSNVVFSPSGGVVTLFSEVVDVSPTSQVKTFILPITLVGASSMLPLHIQATGQLAAVQFPQNIFTPSSPNYALYPLWSNIDNGISVPPAVPYHIACSVVDATQILSTVGLFGSPNAMFWQASGPIAPRIYNVGIVSPHQTPMNLTLSKDPSATWLNATLNTSTTPATVFLSVNSTATPSQYSTTLSVTSPQEPGVTLPIPVTFNDEPSPWFTRYGFTHSASYVPQVVAPGMPFLIGGGEFGPSTLAGFTLGSNGFVSTNVGNTQVLFDGQAAPLIYSVNIGGTGYVAGLAPFELSGKTQTNVQVVYNGVMSQPVPIFVVDAVPGLLTADTSGGGEGAIRNADQSVNSASNPASPNEVVSAYGGGGGQTTPVGRTGGVTAVGAPVGVFNLSVKVFLDGVQITDVPYSGPAPDLIEGYFQVNFRIPANARSGDLPLQIQIGDKLTQPGVTVSVK